MTQHHVWYGGAALVLATIFFYRLYKHWRRPCGHCGSHRVTRWFEMRRPDGFPPVGRRFECSVVHRCNNPHCAHFHRRVEVRVFVKTFNAFEMWWRQLKGQHFL